ncbi:selenide, water dikinase SelD [uncultured Pelagimonas sp.]|uniref:selenide, water dikinase SelD n=1 Tax=uncultured Pelagimonas sp. TaxID=1618102 RepID=UPI002614C4D7|nr:selenide, water dikinase SelD [uncultured Pelagimonas sp.]
MQKTDFPFTRDLVLVGGGHSHALVLRKWGMNPLAGVRVTLINPGPTAPYSGMLPGFLAGHYQRSELDIDLIRLARFSGARVILGKASGLDQEKRLVSLECGQNIHFDIASIDVGITSKMPTLQGFSQHGTPAKPLHAFAYAWEQFRQKPGDAKVAVIGGGIAGVEIALAFAHALSIRQRDYKVTLIDAGSVVGSLRQSARTKLIAELQSYNIDILEHAKISEISALGVVLEGENLIPAGFVCGAAGAHPHSWLRSTGLDLNDGFIEVSSTLQSSNPSIFAVGDCAHMSESPRPKAGVFAVRQADTLFDNLRATLAENRRLKHHQPQKDYLKLISLGRKSALGDRFGVAFRGAAVWRWKNRIDQSFMSKFKNLPGTNQPEPPTECAAGLKAELGGPPLCGGCASKLGQPALEYALAQRSLFDRPDIRRLPGDDAAILCTGGVQQVISTDHLRAFVNDPIVMTKIAANHALGDIWSMGATPQVATATIILPRLSTALATRSLHEIMTTADHIFSEVGAVIAGGHSSQGSELTIGFTVVGTCDTAPITISGASPGQSLILTKPIGSGVLMAAEMSGLAEGDWVAFALEKMCQSQAQAARILGKAKAMTDVTGFGLAGHLMNICQASNVGADLNLEAVPTFPGAIELATQKIRSSLFLENKQVLPDTRSSPINDLLFDPQTAGGLLAAVEGDPAPILASLEAADYTAALIGRTTDKIGQISIC